MHVKEAERRLGSTIPWLCDTMDNEVKHKLGDAPNSEFVLDAEGKIVVRRAWSNPDQLRRDLQELVGDVDRVTKIADLDLKTIPPPKAAAAGVVPRLKLEGGYSPVIVQPQESEHPFYVKLRAEADENLLRSGNGKLYLGFLLDPIYHVHWNNLVEPIRFEITTVNGVEITPAAGAGPQVKEPSDIDPREFLVTVESPGRVTQPLEVEIKFFACNDSEGWCKPVTQKYLVELSVDRDAGQVQGRSRRGGDMAANSPAGRPKGRPGMRPGRGTPENPANQVFGILARIDSEKRTITIRAQRGGEREVRVGADTPVLRNGSASDLEKLQEGDRVMVELSRPDGESSPAAMRVRARSS